MAEAIGVNDYKALLTLWMPRYSTWGIMWNLNSWHFLQNNPKEGCTNFPLSIKPTSTIHSIVTHYSQDKYMFWLFFLNISHQILLVCSVWIPLSLHSAYTHCYCFHCGVGVVETISFYLVVSALSCKGLGWAKHNIFKEFGGLWWVHFLLCMDQLGLYLLR